MRVLVYTPDHIYRCEKEEFVFQTRAEFGQAAITDLSLDLGRSDNDIQSWEELKDQLKLEAGAYEAILVPINLTTGPKRTDKDVDADVTALCDMAKRMKRVNVAVYLTNGLEKRTTEAKLQLMSAGIFMIHDDGDDVRLLHAKIKAAAGMPEIKGLKPTQAGPLIIDHEKMTVSYNGRLLQLGGQPYKFLSYVARFQGQVVANESIKANIDSMDIGSRTISSHIFKIREVIDEAAGFKVAHAIIKTVWGQGFLLVNDDDARDAEVFAKSNADKQNAHKIKTGEEVKIDDWLTLEIGPDGASAVKGTPITLNATLTKVFLHAAKNPEKIISLKNAADIFPESKNARALLSISFLKLRKAFDTDYPHMLLHISRLGEVFCSKARVQELPKIVRDLKRLPQYAPPAL